MTHAFFKALLFLSAGAVIIACHHEQDILKMGGLRKKLPLVYACFLVGGSALAALPLTSGFVSKDEILWLAYSSGHTELLVAGLFGAMLTAIYTFRLVFLVFHGESKIEAHAGSGVAYSLPLAVLLVLSTVVGAFFHPPLADVLPSPIIKNMPFSKHAFEFMSVMVALSGIVIAAFFFLGNRQPMKTFFASNFSHGFRCLWKYAWGFDWLYDRIFVRPFLFLVRINGRDAVDVMIESIPLVVKGAHKALSATQNGHLRWYATAMISGVIAVLVVVVWL